jgi:DICT domain-containing protein
MWRLQLSVIFKRKLTFTRGTDVPDITIDPTLSVYQLAARSQEQRIVVNHRRTMLVISHEIENTIIKHQVRARVFSAFQWMSRFTPQVARYQRLAQFAEAVYVFGCMDTVPPPIANVHYIPLKQTDQLAKEWFLIADSPEYFTALATEEITPPRTPEEERQFQGIWTFDEDLVSIMQEWLTSLVDARPLLGTDKRNYQRQVKLMSDALAGLTARMARSTDGTSAEIARSVAMAAPENK